MPLVGVFQQTVLPLHLLVTEDVAKFEKNEKEDGVSISMVIQIRGGGVMDEMKRGV